MYLAHIRDLDFGPDLIFHYGPLAYLDDPVLFDAPHAAVALLYVGLLQLALVATLLFLLTRRFSLLVAGAVTWVVAAIAPNAVAPAELTVFVTFLVCMAALAGLGEARYHRWLVPLGGALAGALILVKLDTGIGMLAMLAFTVWALPPGGWRSEALLAPAFVLGMLTGWLLGGESLGALPDYLRAAVDMLTGYVGATAAEAGHKWDYPAAALLIGLMVLLIAKASKPVSRIAFVGTVAVFAFLEFRHAFVHHDPFHAHAFFLVALVVPLALIWEEQQWSLAGLAVSGAALVVLMASIVGAGPLLKSLDGRKAFRDPISAVSDGSQQVRALVLPSRRREVYAEGRRSIRAKLRLRPDTVAKLQGHTVHVDPWEVTAVWAYDLPWRPTRVFQPFNAWTERLDDLSAEDLAKAEGPQRILRIKPPVSLDDHDPDFESPAYMLAMICNYRPLEVSPQVQVLARTRGRCSAPKSLGSRRLEPGRSVRVPGAGGADQLVYARISIARPLLGRLRNLLFKPLTLPEVILNGHERYRLVAETANDPLVMRVPNRAGFAPNFRQPPRTTSLRIEGVPGTPRVEFAAVRLRR